MSHSVSVETLKNFSPFDSLADEYLRQLAEQASLMRVDKSQLIFKRGKSLPDLYFLLEGEVSLVDATFYARQLGAGDTAARFALNEINNPTKISAIGQGKAALIKVSQALLDQILAWSQASADGRDLPEQDGRFSQDGFLVDDDWVAHLLASPMFARIPPANLQGLFQRFSAREVAAGETIVKAGEVGDFFYVIAQGKAQVFPLGAEPEEPIYLLEGDFFGEEALAGETTRNASVKMVKSGTLMCLGKDDFKALLQAPLLQFVDFQDLPTLIQEQGDVQLLDVRLPIEYRHAALEQTMNIPLSKLRNRLSAIEKGCLYIITDDAGARSQVAAQLLVQQGHNVMILRDTSQHYRDSAE